MDTLIEHARALRPEEREEQYKETLSYAATERRARRRAGRIGWIVGILGQAEACMAIAAIIIILPLKTTVVKFVEVDTATGWVGEASGANDAPKIFNQRVAQRDIRQYIEAREGYVPETDPVKWRVVRAMSSNDEFEIYKAWRKTDLAPVKALATGGHVNVMNFHYSKPTYGKDNTISYTVRYERVEVKGDSVGPRAYWHADIDFQWHPEMTMTDEDMQVNPEGFQAIAFKSRRD